MANGKQKNELTLVRDGANVPGEITSQNDSIRDMLLEHSVTMERKTIALREALAARERKMAMALERLQAWNDGLDEALAEQFSKE